MKSNLGASTPHFNAKKMDPGTEKMTFFGAIWTPSWTARSLRSLAPACSRIAVENGPCDHRQARSLARLPNPCQESMNLLSRSTQVGWLTHSLRSFVRVGLASLARPMGFQSVGLAHSLRSFARAPTTKDDHDRQHPDGWLAHSLRSFARARGLRPLVCPPLPPR